jgi:hypothetical protein
MEETKYTYKCSKCGRTEEGSIDKPEPICCKIVMIKDHLGQCTIADHPEMTRNNDESEPCDDGRGKQVPKK